MKTCQFFLPAACLLVVAPLSRAQSADSDHDGLNDSLEQQLLEQFKPTFMVGAHDCSTRPAEFTLGIRTPEVKLENGTIYGQAFPHPAVNNQSPEVELHFYHLWRTDCGRHGHPLDTEHVAVLVEASDARLATARWKALTWYAAAHENTVCDVSQIARASTLHAEEQGATVWISPGKHASYLNEALCQKGCGADRCEQMIPLSTLAVINLGEPAYPANGSLFVHSPAWPLEAKMSTTNFPVAALARLDTLPGNDIAWFNPGRHPAQGIIAHSSATEGAMAQSGEDTLVALSLAGNTTGAALGESSDSTGNALANAGSRTTKAVGKGYTSTRHALTTSLHHVGRALHVDQPPSAQTELAPNEP